MAGYSGTPLAAKLGIRAGARVALVHAPEGFAQILDLPEDVELSDSAQPGCDVVLAFYRELAILAAEWEMLAESAVRDGAVWIAWPKKASKVPTDITEDRLREFVLPSTPFVDNKVCAIDAIWSGLRFVRRRHLRSGRESAASAE